MPRADLPVSLLLRALPELPDFAVLRRAILAASAADPRAEWAGSRSYATYEQRVMPIAELGGALRSSYRDGLRRLKRIHRALERAFARVADDEGDEAVSELLALGEAAEHDDHWQDAVAFYQLAMDLCGIAATEPRTEILALRRAARARLRAGQMIEAEAFYRASFGYAEAHADTESQVIALIGLGNIASLQGRWSGAASQYQNALQRATSDHAQLRGQIHINLSMTARELHEHGQARTHLDQARSLWEDLTPDDRAVWFNNSGLLHIALGQLDDAETAFADALEQAPGHFDCAMIFDNLAEIATLRDQWARAELYARRAEEHALTVGSQRALAEAYLRLGRLHRARRDANAVGFFEQAVAIARNGPYPAVEARAHHEYALFRRELGDLDDARGELLQAIALFSEIGAHAAETTARTDLAALENPLSGLADGA